MGISQNVGGSTVLAEDAEYAFDIPTLLRACVELAVAVCSCAALAEGVIALGIYRMLAADACQVAFAVANVAPALQDDGPYAQLDEAQRSEKSAGASTDDDGLARFRHVGVAKRLEREGRRLLVHPYLKREVDENSALACVDAALQHTDILYCPCVDTFLPCDIFLYCRCARRNLRQHSNLIFLYHSSAKVNIENEKVTKITVKRIKNLCIRQGNIW